MDALAVRAGLDGASQNRSQKRAREVDCIAHAETVNGGEGHVLPDVDQAAHTQLELVRMRREIAAMHGAHGGPRVDIEARNEPQLGRQLFEDEAQDTGLVSSPRPPAGEHDGSPHALPRLLARNRIRLRSQGPHPGKDALP